MAGRCPILIVGAGPVGLALALGLSRYRIRSVLIERDNWISERSKAPGVLGRTQEIFRQWGVFETFQKRATLLPCPTAYAAETNEPIMTLDLAAVADECATPYLGILEQAKTEEILLEAVKASGYCEVRFSTELMGLRQEEREATAALEGAAGSETLTAEYVVGCDGAGSTVRDLLGLDFEGETYEVKPILIDVRLKDERNDLPWPRVLSRSSGLQFAVRLEEDLWRIVSLDQDEGDGDSVEPELISKKVHDLFGEGPFETVWANRFQIHRRQSTRYRVGRVLLAGDAAHVNSPAGAQGMNSGIQDAHNLAWKLAAVLRGAEVDPLMASYVVERCGVVSREIEPRTDFLTRALGLTPLWVRNFGLFLLDAAMNSEAVRRKVARQMLMLSQSYGSSSLIGEGRAAGERAPDVVLSDGQRLYDRLGLEPALLSLGDVEVAMTGIKRIQIAEPPSLLTERLGFESGWALVRPDHIVAWAEKGPFRSSQPIDQMVRLLAQSGDA
jgi:2-polyprenyl-6-methoxyphenol hydroxylase-like FAD-dependent oxidoreductase